MVTLSAPITSRSVRVSIRCVIGFSPVGVWIRLLASPTRMAVAMPQMITHVAGRRSGVHPSECQNGRSYTTRNISRSEPNRRPYMTNMPAARLTTSNLSHFMATHSTAQPASIPAIPMARNQSRSE